MAKNTTAPIPTPTQQLATVNPVTLLVRDQARADATPDEGLIASVRQHGILQPPIVAPGPRDGTYVILFGHRRVGAAIAAGMEQISVIVRDAHTLDSDALTLEEQLVENERRAQLTSKDIAAGYSKLALFGMRPEDIAASLGEKTERVRAGLKIVDSTKASELVTANPVIDFEQAAAIADFDDHPQLQRKLIETASVNPANFQRDPQSFRTQREVDARVTKLKDQLDAADVPLADVVFYSSDWWSGKNANAQKGRSLDRLDIRPEDHLECPGHAAIIHKAQATYLNERPDSWLLYVCTDWEANGHVAPERTKDAEELERDAAWKREDEARRARDEIIAANTRARRIWIHGYLSTGRLRPTATHFEVMADAIAVQLEQRESAPAHITLELLTGEPVKAKGYWEKDNNDEQLRAAIDDGSISGLRIIVAQALATFERRLSHAKTRGYFDALAAWGYTLSDTDREHLAAATATAEETTDHEEQDDE